MRPAALVALVLAVAVLVTDAPAEARRARRAEATAAEDGSQKPKSRRRSRARAEEAAAVDGEASPPKRRRRSRRAVAAEEAADGAPDEAPPKRRRRSRRSAEVLPEDEAGAASEPAPKRRRRSRRRNAPPEEAATANEGLPSVEEIAESPKRKRRSRRRRSGLEASETDAVEAPAPRGKRRRRRSSREPVEPVVAEPAAPAPPAETAPPPVAATPPAPQAAPSPPAVAPLPAAERPPPPPRPVAVSTGNTTVTVETGDGTLVATEAPPVAAPEEKDEATPSALSRRWELFLRTGGGVAGRRFSLGERRQEEKTFGRPEAFLDLELSPLARRAGILGALGVRVTYARAFGIATLDTTSQGTLASRVTDERWFVGALMGGRPLSWLYGSVGGGVTQRTYAIADAVETRPADCSDRLQVICLPHIRQQSLFLELRGRALLGRRFGFELSALALRSLSHDSGAGSIANEGVPVSIGGVGEGTLAVALGDGWGLSLSGWGAWTRHMFPPRLAYAHLDETTFGGRLGLWLGLTP